MEKAFKEKIMIKITFHKEQTFLNDNCKGGDFKTDKIIVDCLIIHPKYTHFKCNDIDYSVLTDSIENINPNYKF